MKLLTTTAFLTLAGAVFAIPSENLLKRATCTFWGFTYPCNKAPAHASTKSTPAAASILTRTSSTPLTTSTFAITTSYTSTTAAVYPSTTAAVPSSTSTSTSGPSAGGKSAYSSGSTASDIDNNTGCTTLTVILARGTSESGNIGSVTGPPLFQQLLSDLGASSLTLQGVKYPASTSGNANCGADGGADMASEVTTILSRCPSTKIALVGYSQGACVVHNAVQSQGLDNSKISAVVLFGDPFNGEAVGSVPSSKVLEICASGDDVCNGSGKYDITSAHLSYGNNAAQAASFIESATGV